MSLSRPTGYAIKAMICLANEHGPHRRIEQKIAACSGVPRPHLARMMRKLNRAGQARSRRGYRGGVWLAWSADRIPLREIGEAIDRPDDFRRIPRATARRRRVLYGE
jgi:Rrf2 family protein